MALLRSAHKMSGVPAPPCAMLRDARGNCQEAGLHRAEARHGSRERATQADAEVVPDDGEGVVLNVPGGFI